MILMKKKEFALNDIDISYIADYAFNNICIMDTFRSYTGEDDEEFCEDSIEELEKAVFRKIALIINEKYGKE